MERTELKGKRTPPVEKKPKIEDDESEDVDMKDISPDTAKEIILGSITDVTRIVS